jgi:hypothetical protein
MEQDLIRRSATMVREAALKTAEDVLKEKSTNVANLLVRVMSPLAASLLSAFSAQFAIICLRALTNEHQSEKTLKQVNKLVAAPLNTGLVQLRTALMLEVDASQENREQETHKISRYRDALRSFDEALALAQDEEKAAVHLYRAFVSTRIPGAETEARLHGSEFATACENLSEALIQKASAEDYAANRSESSAAKIVVERGMGGGGGLVGMSMAADKLKKSQLDSSARTHKVAAENLRSEAQELTECSVLVLSLLHQDSVRP